MSNKKYEVSPKDQDYGRWYQSVLTTSDMIDYSDVGGCYVLKPLAMDIWENIKRDLDRSIRELGVQNCYFPLFVTKSNLEKEASHFADFTPEVAWIVTEDPVVQQKTSEDPEIEEAVKKLNIKGFDVHIRTKTSERYAVRPTSETIIYPHFADWIKKGGYPKINQWANVVRWENKATQPFIRSREFLWQEGHTCHPDKKGAIDEVYKVLAIYRDLYERLLAVPMIDGYKTKSETFPGAELTTTIEGFLPDSGRGIQSATSHYLGQKFSNMFNIKDSNGNLVHQNSWGLTTRSIGIMVMTHSDDRGLVLPPAVAPVQVVLIACGLNSRTSDEDRMNVTKALQVLCEMLNLRGVRAVFDDEDGESPGMKFNKWEVRGVPLRLEFGPKDYHNNTVLFVRRDQPPKSKETYAFSKIDHAFITNYLNEMSKDMLLKARDNVRQNTVYCKTREEVLAALKDKKLTLIDWRDEDDDGKLEDSLKQFCRDNDVNSTKILCIPNISTLRGMGVKLPEDTDTSGQKYALFGRSY